MRTRTARTSPESPMLRHGEASGVVRGFFLGLGGRSPIVALWLFPGGT
jgi:hypothetical protein